MSRLLASPAGETGDEEISQGRLGVVFLSSFSNWFLFLEKHVTSQRLNVIQEPEDPNICKHFLNVRTQLVREVCLEREVCLKSWVWKAVV